MAVRKTTEATETNENVNAEEVTTEKEKTTETTNTASDEVQLVYIGPSLPKGQLKSNTIFMGTKEEILSHVKEITDKIPLVEKMFVPVDQLADKKQKVQTEGNIYNKYYKDIASVSMKLLEEE